VPSLNSISDVDLYQNYTFGLNGYDNDLVIWDRSIKNESLTFASNTSWVSVTSPARTDFSLNYSTSSVSINYDSVLNGNGVGNYSVMINVTDVLGNTDNKTFVVQILNQSVPVWNLSLGDPVSLSLVEDVVFSYNVSVNVSDADGDAITFYYQNVSGSFCSLNSSTFNSSSGAINFTPTDCDVGYHNVTIIAGDGKLNSSHQFNFSVANVADVPSVFLLTGNNGTQYTLTEGFNLSVPESTVLNLSLEINDSDFLIPSAQRLVYYNESLIVDVVVSDSGDADVDLFEFSFDSVSSVADYRVIYISDFTGNVSQIGRYTVLINISDGSGNFTNRTFYLNVTETLDAPVLASISNLSLTVNDVVNFSVNATDDEDDYAGVNLTYSISLLNATAPNLTVGNVTGAVQFDMDSNQSYGGVWVYNLTVSDSDGMTDSQVFYVTVYGNASLVLPAQNYAFSLIENSGSVLNFTINHSVRDNLTYEFWVDSVNCSYQNISDCDYGSFVLRDIENSFGNGSALNWSFVPNFTDEGYGNYKNLTVKVYPNSSNLNFSQRESVVSNFSFKLNISHTNAPVVFAAYPVMGDSQTTYNQQINYDLNSYFSDVDSSDSYYLQAVNLSILSNVSSSNIDANTVRIPSNVSHNNWNLNLSTGYTVAFSEVLNITAWDVNSTGGLLTSAISNNFKVTFTVPVTETVTVTVPTSGGGGSTKLKYFSFKFIFPEDIVISDENYIEIPFSLKNTGTTDLNGINLGSQVSLDGEFSENIRVALENVYISSLKVGQSEDYNMKIFVDTRREGKYKITISADVTSPKFSDWGDFYIELKKINETDAETTLIFTEKFISENPECLELMDLVNDAKEAFSDADFSLSFSLARDAVDACEELLAANEQIKYPVSFIKDNFYYISFSTLMVFLLGFVFYVYKRVRFNKYRVDGSM